MVELKITGMTVKETERLEAAARSAFGPMLDPGGTLSDVELCEKGLLKLASGLVSDMDNQAAAAKANAVTAIFAAQIAPIPIPEPKAPPEPTP